MKTERRNTGQVGWGLAPSLPLPLVYEILIHFLGKPPSRSTVIPSLNRVSKNFKEASEREPTPLEMGQQAVSHRPVNQKETRLHANPKDDKIGDEQIRRGTRGIVTEPLV